MQKNTLSSLCCWLSIFFPFVSPYPIGTDVQPVAFLLVASYFIFNTIPLKINIYVIAILIFSGINIIYINFSADYLFLKRGGFLAVLLLVLFIQAQIDSLNVEVLKKILVAHLVFLGIQFLMPDLFLELFGHFIRAVTYFEGDVRGVHGLNAEPGGAAAVLSGLYFIISLKYKENSVLLINSRKVLSLCLFGLMLTKSGLSIVCGFLIMWYHFLTFKSDRFIIMSFLFSIFIYFVINLDSSSRALDLIITVADIGMGIIFLDGSIAERFLGLSYGIYSLMVSPLGFGGGGYSIGAQIIENEYSLSAIYGSAREQISGSISVMGVYLVEFGYIYVLFILIVFLYNFPRRMSSLPIFILAVGFSIFSFSVAFPMTWILFHLVRMNNRSIGSIRVRIPRRLFFVNPTNNG